MTSNSTEFCTLVFLFVFFFQELFSIFFSVDFSFVASAAEKVRSLVDELGMQHAAAAAAAASARHPKRDLFTLRVLRF